MCKPHWQLVPKPLRDAVWMSWRRRQQGFKGAVNEHQLAKRDAIEAAAAAGEPPQKELAL